MIAAVGGHRVNWSAVFSKVVIPAVVAPVIAIVVAAVCTWPIYRVTHGVPQKRTDGGFRRSQIGSAALVSLAHGTDDAQKTMGVIFLALISYGAVSGTSSVPPSWVIVSCALAIAAGTYVGSGSSEPWARGWSRSSRRKGWPPSRHRPRSSCSPPTSAMRCLPPRSRPDLAGHAAAGRHRRPLTSATGTLPGTPVS